MLPPFLLLFIGLFPVSLGRNFLSANAFLDVDKITSRASVKITVNGHMHCSGTIISSNIVYTAAHCLHRYRVGSLGVHTASDLKRRYEIEEVYIPEEFPKGADFYKSVQSSCDPDGCNTECRKTGDKLEFYKNHYDYGLILLKEELPICADDPEGPVAAAFESRLDSRYARKYSPGLDNHECFVAGFGDTEHNPSKAGNISLAIISHFDGYYEQACDQPTHKGIFTRFHTSDDRNPYETEVCEGDSGSGAVCISNGGKHIGVVGVNIQVLPFEKGPTCRAARDTISLSIRDHESDLLDAIECWGETDNFKKWGQTCSAFLKANPFNSVMAHYLKRLAEF